MLLVWKSLDYTLHNSYLPHWLVLLQTRHSPANQAFNCRKSWGQGGKDNLY